METRAQAEANLDRRSPTTCRLLILRMVTVVVEEGIFELLVVAWAVGAVAFECETVVL